MNIFTDDENNILEKNKKLYLDEEDRDDVDRSAEGKEEEKEKEKEPDSPENKVKLKLGDIIEIKAPNHDRLHEQSFFVDYIDEKSMVLLNIASNEYSQLGLDNDGFLTDESIETIYILSRSDEPGYARQNGLLPKQWVDIYIGGDVPVIITGEITNLDLDMIEVTTYPEMDVIYIDFAYKGLPRDIPFERIELRDRPSMANQGRRASMENVDADEGDEEEKVDVPVDMNTREEDLNTTLGSIIQTENVEIPDKELFDTLNSLYLSADNVTFGEELEDLEQVVEIPENQRRYGIETQANDLMDELLSMIPNSRRTKDVLDRVHLLIERFKQLRSMFSKFDTNHNVLGYVQLGPLHKPLVQKLTQLNTQLSWILPVVKQRRYMYGVDPAMEREIDEDSPISDVIVANLDNEIQKERELYKQYTKNTLPNGVNKYEYLVHQLNDIHTCVVPENFCDAGLTIQQPIMTAYDTIVSNLEDFYSTVSDSNTRPGKLDALNRRRFVIQRYQLGTNKKEKVVLRSGKTEHVSKTFTPNDKMTIQSLVLLPEPAVKFSHIHLPGTKLLTKTNLHHNYLSLFRLFKKNTDIDIHFVDDLEREILYGDDYLNTGSRKSNEEPPNEFLTTMKEYFLDSHLDNNKNKFEKYLNVVVPKTRILFRIIRKYLRHHLSMVDIVKELEPFYIYANDLTYRQYDEIRYYIKHKIVDWKKKLVNRLELFKRLVRRSSQGPSREMNIIKRILYENAGLLGMMEDAYKLKEESQDAKSAAWEMFSASEILYNAIQTDNAELLTDVVTTMMIKTLSTPGNLLEAFEPGNLDNLSDLEKIKPNDCTRRYLAKKYTTMTAMTQDNGKEDVFFDKDMDDTVYSLLDSYKKEKREMKPNEFLEFLTMNLMTKHKLSMESAGDLAKTLVEGKKRVLEGMFCVVQITRNSPDSPPWAPSSPELVTGGFKVQRNYYYRRVKNQWVHDTTIDEEAFIDNNTLFCNIQSDCFKNQKTNVCEPTDLVKQRLKEMTQQRMKDEFDRRVTGSIEELEKAIKSRLENDFKRIVRERRLNVIRQEKYNNMAYEIGKLLIQDDQVESPYRSLSELVLSQDDFQKRQADIVKFVDMYCREPMIDDLDENPAWLYCRETNVPLFPQSLYKLAMTYVSKGDYMSKLNEICRTVGIISDDGDSIVDRYTGKVLRKIDFVAEDAFTDEGFRIVTHDVMEEDLETRLENMFATTNVGVSMNKVGKEVFESAMNQTIYNITAALCNNMGIPVESVQHFVMIATGEILEKHVQSSEVYEKHAQAMEKKKGIRPIPYDIYRDRFMFWTLGSCLLVAIQTAIPSFRTKKTFPGCVRSFGGYPFDGGVEDISGIEYLACVLYKMKSSTVPWNAIEKLDLKTYSAKIREMLEKIILPNRPDIEQMYVAKREYLLLHPNEVVPPDHALDRWRSFLPPVVEFSVISKLRPVNAAYEREMMDLITKGHRDQRTHLSMIRSRILQYGYAIIEAINRIVKTKDVLLKTSSKIPYLENACCQDPLYPEPIRYFAKENPAILQYMETVGYLSNMLQDIHVLSSKGLVLYHPGFTGTSFPMIGDISLTENIYDAYFHYCNFDNELPIPDAYLAVCPEKWSKISGYKPEWSIYDKIEFFKMNGKQYKPENLDQLMVLVHNQHRIEIEEPHEYTQVDVLRDLLESFEQRESVVVEEIFRQRLAEVVSGFDPQKMTEEPRPELDRFKDYLYKANEQMYYAIINFMDKNGNLSDAKFSDFQEWLLSPLERGMTDSENIVFTKDSLYKTVQQGKNSVYMMSKLLPQMILEEKIYNKIPEHWDLAAVHNRDLENFHNKFWEEIRPFFGDRVLQILLREVRERLNDIFLLVSELPTYSPIAKADREFHSMFDTQTSYFLYIYLLYSTMYEYIVCSENPEMLYTDSVAAKKRRKQEILDQADESKSIRSENITTEEDAGEVTTELEDIQIEMGNQAELKSRVASLLLAFVELDKENQTYFYTYKEISKKVGLSKKQEKKRITDYLGSLQDDEREIENLFKKYKMGRWNAGMQKGLVHYDKATYERQREESAADAFLGDMGSGVGLVPDTGRSAEDLDREMAEDAAHQQDDEGIQFREFGDEYQDGVYYAEDRDPDDYE
jgi:hypothetical protein